MEDEHIALIRERLVRTETTVESMKEDFQELKSFMKDHTERMENLVKAQSERVEVMWGFISKWRILAVVFMTLGAGVTAIINAYFDASHWLRKLLIGH